MASLSMTALKWDKLAKEIQSHKWQLEKEGKSPTTITTSVYKLNQFGKICDINNPEEVKEALAKANLKNSTKNTIVGIFKRYYKSKCIPWQPPTYKPEERIPFIPLEKEIDQLISASHAKLSTLLQLIKETGARIGEALQTKWIDIDEKRKVITITPEKGSHARILPISTKLIEMLHNIKNETNYVFTVSYKGIRETLRLRRKTLAKKINNPRINQITFHTLRHWKGTMEYHKTKDIYHVKTILGHKSIKNTEIYINIEHALFINEECEYHTATAKTIQEAQKLLEVGFEYVTEIETIKLFRKRK